MSISGLHEIIEKKAQNVCQIVAYKNGEKVYSDCFHDYKETDSCHVASVTKSVISLLVGIAIDKGYILNVEQNVLDFFLEYKIKRGEKTIQDVKIKHLLTMQAPYKYRFEPWSKICGSEDWTVGALDFLGGKKGITGEFLYATLGSHILSGIITKTSGMNTVDFANKYLFSPLGIKEHTNFSVRKPEEHRLFIMSKEPKAAHWFADPQGVATAGFGLCLSADDIAKIGMIYLNEGMYGDERIVSSKWIKESTKPYYKCGKKFGNMSYGYMWWIIDEEKSIYAAIGDGGNVIYVNPNEKIVVGVVSTFKPRVFDRVDFIREYIEPNM